MAFGTDFEPDTGNSGSKCINYHSIEFDEATQKSVSNLSPLGGTGYTSS